MSHRGTWVPNQLHALVQGGTLSVTEAWMAMLISSLSATEKGCYASNEYLGKKIKKSARNVRYILERLELAGILICQFSGGVRRMWIDLDGNSTDTRRHAYFKSYIPWEEPTLNDED